MKIYFDGDGGFSVSIVGRMYIFKFVFVQVMWFVLQVFYKVCEVVWRYNYFFGGVVFIWVIYYESCISFEQSCINEWNVMQDLEFMWFDFFVLFVDKFIEGERIECFIKVKF